MSRRIITAETIDEVLAAGQTQLLLEAGDIVTPLAKDYATERGLALVISEAGNATAASPIPAAPTLASPVSAAAVRRAVIAALGHEPAGLDAAIEKAMR